MTQQYDVFLSHSNADKPAVEALARKLRDAGIEPFLDKWHLIPGDPWQEALEEALDASRTCAVFLGPKGLGAWQNEEMRSALETRVGNRAFRVIPVLLPGSFEPRREDLPRFLRRLTWVDFRAGLDDEDAFHRLVSGIRGQAPGPSGGGGGGPAKPFLPYRCMMGQEPEGWVHRQEYNEVLDALCAKEGAPAGRSVGITTALRGAGGFGKTALARKLCFDPKVREAYPDGILWATMGEEADSNSRLREIRDLLRWWTGEEPPAFETVAAAGAKLRESLNGAWALVVVDDVWRPDDVAPFQGLGESCALLITTRDSRTLPADSKPIKVDAMASSEAVDLLRSGLPSSSPDGFKSLAAHLGEWPLLLKLVNGPLREMVKEGLSISEALQEIEGALETEGFSAFDQSDSASRHAAASRAILVSVRRLPESEQEFFFQLAIFPEDEDIPVSVLERYWGTSHFGATRICQHLYDLSLLLEFDRKNGTIRLHDVTRRVLMEQRTEELSSLHSRLLEAYRPASGKWEDLSREESYLWHRLRDHFLGSGGRDEFKALLVRFLFIEAKLLATDINSVIGDYEPFVGEDQELRLVQATLRLSAHVLARDRKQLASQLLGRLLGRKEPSLHTLLEEARSWQGGSWFRPKTGSLTQVGGALLRTLEGHTDYVNAVAVLNGRLVVSASDDGTLRVWDLENGQCLRILEGHMGFVNSVAVLDSQHIISGHLLGTLCIWDLDTEQIIGVLEGHEEYVAAVAVLDDQRAISASGDKTLRVWDLKTRQTLHILKGHTEFVDAVAVLDGQRAISASGDKTLRVWDLKTGQTLNILEGHTESVDAVAVLDSQRAISASSDKTLRVWDLKMGKTLHVLEGHKASVTAVAVLDSQRAVSASDDGTFRLWDLKAGQLLRAIESHTVSVNSLAALDSQHVISASSGGNLRVWDFGIKQRQIPLKGHSGWVSAMAVVNDRRAVSASADGAFQVWDLETGQFVRALEGHTAEIRAVAILDDRRVISASNALNIWDLETGQILRTLEGHTDCVTAVDVLDQRLVVSAEIDLLLRVWDLENGQILRTLEGNIDGIRAIAFVGDQYVVSADMGHMLRLWELYSGKFLRTLQGHSHWVNAVTALDNQRILSASSDGMLRIWDLQTGQTLRILKGHIGGVNSVAVLSYRHAISAADDQTLRLWDLENGITLAVMTLDAPALAVAATPDGKIIVAGDYSGRIHFFDLVEPE